MMAQYCTMKKLPYKTKSSRGQKIHFENFHTTSFMIYKIKDYGVWRIFSSKAYSKNYIYEFIYHKLNHEVGNILLNL